MTGRCGERAFMGWRMDRSGAGTMEDYVDEQLAMAEFLRQHLHTISPDHADRLASAVYPPGTDVAAATAARYRIYAEAWTVSLRGDPAYLAWRREREPGYMPLDDSEPIALARAWESLTPEAWAALPEEYREERVRLAREQIVAEQRESRGTTEDTP
jgi:hypothetical protein